MKSLGDDSLPIDVTKDERTESAMSHKNIMELSQGKILLKHIFEDFRSITLDRKQFFSVPTDHFTHSILSWTQNGGSRHASRFIILLFT